jgi:hypothetical protein
MTRRTLTLLKIVGVLIASMRECLSGEPGQDVS